MYMRSEMGSDDGHDFSTCISSVTTMLVDLFATYIPTQVPSSYPYPSINLEVIPRYLESGIPHFDIRDRRGVS